MRNEKRSYAMRSSFLYRVDRNSTVLFRQIYPKPNCIQTSIIKMIDQLTDSWRSCWTNPRLGVYPKKKNSDSRTPYTIIFRTTSLVEFVCLNMEVKVARFESTPWRETFNPRPTETAVKSYRVPTQSARDLARTPSIGFLYLRRHSKDRLCRSVWWTLTFRARKAANGVCTRLD